MWVQEVHPQEHPFVPAFLPAKRTPSRTQIAISNAFVRLIGIVGPYQGGSGNAEGSYQTDASLVGGLSFRVR